MPETYGAQECKAFFVQESTYGQTPSNPTMTGIPAENIEPSISPSLIKVRGIGSRDLIALKKGLRLPTLKITHLIPSDSPLSLIQHGVSATSLNSLSVQVLYFKGNFASATDIISLLYKGCRIDKLTLEGSVDAVAKATVEIIGQDVTVGTSKISGATYNEPTGVLGPCDYTIQKGAGDGSNYTEILRVSDWKLSIENNLKPVPVVRGSSSYLLKYLQPRQRELSGELTFEFEDKTEFDDVINDSEFSIRMRLGTSGGVMWRYCKWEEVKTPTKIEDLVSLKARFTAKDIIIA